jgi:DMSO/TMAO reductase YedYZ heme-binding membrane subunit
MTKIWGIAISGAVVIVAFLTLTSIGHVVDLAVQHFMLFYAGVFALIGLCASVGAGLVATDRIVLHPGHRVWVQSAHRAISFGALAFLLIHIVTEILAQRVHVIDAVVPFLSPFRTFYIGLGTIASDLIILLVITGIFRKRFTGEGRNVWRWRAIHYTSYLAFVFGVWHGLLGGRPGKPYVDWSYGFVVAFVAFGLAVRILANSLRPKESLSAPPVSESAGSGAASLRAAAMFAQFGAVRAATPPMMAAGGGATMLPASGPATGPMRALPAGSAGTTIQAAPVYEPGYEGPPRYQGAPRPVQAVPDSTISGPLPRVQGPPSGGFRRPMSGPMPAVPGPVSGPMPTVAGPMSGPMPAMPGPATGPMPQAPGMPSGPYGRPRTGPMPRVQGPASGGFQRPATGPMPGVPRGATGGFQRPATGPMPAVDYDAPAYGGYENPAYGGYDSPGYGAYDNPGYGGYESPEYGGAPQWDAVDQDAAYGYPGRDELR